MKIGYPSCSASFTTDCSVQETANRILNTVADQRNNFKLVSTEYSDVTQIVFNANTASLLERNSFLPVTTVKIAQRNTGSLVSVSFELKKSVKVIMTIISILLILFELVFCVICFSGQSTTILPVFIPIGMLLFTYVFSFFGMKLSSKGVLKTLFDGVKRGGEDYLPLIRMR